MRFKDFLLSLYSLSFVFYASEEFEFIAHLTKPLTGKNNLPWSIDVFTFQYYDSTYKAVDKTAQ